jgi:FAD:protein FMN transferase
MKSRSSEIRRARPLLGTLVEIGAAGANAAIGIEAAFQEIETIHRLMSFHEADSDVSRINRASAGEIVPIDHRTFEVLSCAQLISRLSVGAFDVTVGGKLVEEGLLPKPHGSVSFDGHASFEDIVLLSRNLVTLKRRVYIDFGGIAKGYAVDRGVMALRKSAVSSGIVNAGGDLFVLGKAQPVHARHPENAALVLPLGPIANAAVASSSGVFSAQRNDRADALIDPRRHVRATWRQGITVIAPSCMIADALTKVVRLVPRRATKILSHFGAQAVVIDRRGIRVFQTSESPRDLFGITALIPSRPQTTRNSAAHQADAYER